MFNFDWSVLGIISLLLIASLLPVDRASAEVDPVKVASTRMKDGQSTVLHPAETLRSETGSVQSPVQQSSPSSDESRSIQSQTQTPSEPMTQARSLGNYIGIGGGIGLSNNNQTALGSGGLAILTRTQLTDNLAIHGATVVFGKRPPASTFALTVGVPIRNQSSGRVVAFPFVGGGLLLRTNNGLKVNPLVTTGVDVPLFNDFTATARVSVGFTDNTDVGLLLGVGYKFRL